MLRFLCVVIYLGLAFINAGFLVASFQRRYPSVKQEGYRGDLCVGIGVSLLFGPIGWILTLFLTGFYEYGWQLRREAKCPTG